MIYLITHFLTVPCYSNVRRLPTVHQICKKCNKPLRSLVSRTDSEGRDNHFSCVEKEI